MIRRSPVLFAVFVTAGAFAQMVTTPNRYGSPSGGWGNVNYPGTGHPPSVISPSVVSSATYANRLGATVRGGYPAYNGFGRGVPHPQHSRQVIVPVPMIIGGVGFYPYDTSGGYQGQGYAQDPGAAQQQPATPPVVIINQSYQPETANPDVRDYSNVDLPPGAIRSYDAPVHPMPDPNDSLRGKKAADDKPTIFLIAFKDHTILPALAYWVQGDTLTYITEQGTQNHTSLSLIDKDFSRQLNDERQVDFSLPN